MSDQLKKALAAHDFETLKSIGYELEAYAGQEIRGKDARVLRAQILKGYSGLPQGDRLSFLDDITKYVKVSPQAEVEPVDNITSLAIVLSYNLSPVIGIGSVIVSPTRFAQSATTLGYCSVKKARQLLSEGRTVVTDPKYTEAKPEEIQNLFGSVSFL